MKVFVTGGAGFIGSHSTEELIKSGADVRVFDNLSTGSLDNMRRLEEREQFVLGDILDLDALTAAMAGCDAVLHLAAVVSVPLSIAHPEHAHAVNATGALNVLEAARKNGIKRVVMASSAAVYGANQELPLPESAPPQPLSPYAAQKWQNEAYAKVYSDLHGLETVCLRYFNVFGPRQDPSSPYSGVLSRFIAATSAGEAVTIFGDGAQTRDFVYVADVARANALALRAPAVGGQVLNIGAGKGVSVLEAYTEIQRLAMGARVDPTFGPARAGDVRHSLADIRRATERLGYRPTHSFAAGLDLTLAWMRARRPHDAYVLIR